MPVGNPITDISSAGNFVPITRTLTINGVAFDLSANRSWTVGTGSVTSVGLIMPTGFAVSSSPVTSAGDLTVAFASGYSLPTNASQATWDSAYTNRITSLTTTGNSGVSTLISNTLNVPEYTLAGLGGMANVFTTLGDLIYSNAGGLPVRRSPNITATKMFLSQTGDGTTSAAPQWSTVTATDVGAVPTSRQLTINGVAYDLSADRTWNVGTVTSIGITMPAAFTVTGSPVTSSGTIAITGAGDTTQYIAGDGSLIAFPITGQAGTLVREVRNNTGATLTKGTVVYINGALGNKPTVAKAFATSDATSAQTFGLIQADIPNNANGYLVAFGDLDGLNTSAFTEGVQLYLSSTTAGAYTITKQYAPNHLVYIGVITRSHPTMGRIEVRIQNGYEMDELHDVDALNPNNNDGLFYNSTNDLWEHKTIATALGFTPVTNARTITINGTAFDLSADRTYNVGTVTSVALSVPTGLSITGSPITGSGTLAIGLQSGYSIPTTSSQTNWDAAYNDKINSAAVTGTTTKTLTLNQQDGGTVTATWTDDNTDAVTSVFGRTGAVVAVGGDYNTSQVTELTNLYFTDARARSAISLTTTGTSGAATYVSGTGVLNVPNYTAAGLGAVPTSRTLTINDVAFDLTADRSYSVGDFGTW